LFLLLQFGSHIFLLAWEDLIKTRHGGCFRNAKSEHYEVYGLIDAAGDSTLDAHKYGVKRMLQVGVAPVTLEQLVSEWMHDWNNPKAGELVKEVYSKYGAMIGLHFTEGRQLGA
jgi:hypothetical protein